MNIFLRWIPKFNIWGRARAANEELHQLPQLKQAYVGLMVCLFKSSMGEPLAGMMDDPSKFSPSECLAIWEVLLNLGFKTDDKLKMYQKIGLPPSPALLTHVKLVDVARQVMMSTVGAGYARSAMPSVIRSWKLLLAARPFSIAALSEIREVDKLMKSTYEGLDSFTLEDETWLKLASETPSFLKS